MKLLVSDYDGTLKSSVKNLKINIETIKEFVSQGNTFCIATGRPYDSIKKEIDLYKIPYNYLICNNGLTIFDNNDNLLYSKVMDIEDIIFFLKFANINPKNYSLYNIYGIKSNINVIYVKISNLGLSQICQMKKDINNWFNDLSVYTSFNNLYLESKTNKALGIKKLMEIERLSFDANDIYTVGDYKNDLDMLKEFNGYKVLFSYPCLLGKKIKTCMEVHTLVKKIMR